MNLEAIYHRPKLNWASIHDHKTLELRLRTKRDDVRQVQIVHGDKYAWHTTRQLSAMTWMCSDERFDYWQVFIEPPFRRIRYCFAIGEGSEMVWLTERGIVGEEPDNPHTTFFDFPFINLIDAFAPPAWVKDAIFYQIFPERFANGDKTNDPANSQAWGGVPEPDNFFGGDLQGVLDHLDHLVALGINAIYFTPIFDSPTNHKYDTRDYMKVDPHFGTNETVKSLVDACHARGIRVLLDAVFNHCGNEFPPFVDCVQHGAESRYADWFHVREWPIVVEDGLPSYDTFAFEPRMPKLNTENPEVKQYLLEVAEYWIKEVGIDGWRLDVANEVDHAFWREFRKVVKSVNPEAYLLAEIWHDSMMWLQGDQFDAIMNYTFTNAVSDFFMKHELDARQFSDRIGGLLASYPTKVNEVAFNLLGSHDTPRLLTLCNGDKRRMKLATWFQFTFLGTPCIYYGDEIGLQGGTDPGCRACMEWEQDRQDHDLFQHFQTVIRIRQQHDALRTGKFRMLHAEEEGAVTVYERFNKQERVIVALNNGDKPERLSITMDGQWRSLMQGDQVKLAREGQLYLELAPYEAQLWQAVNP